MTANVAKADGWLFCDNCTTTDQFKQVAKSSTTVAGTTDWAVGNRVTGKVMFVTVTYTPPGQNPAFRTAGDAIFYSKRGGRSEIIEYKSTGPVVLAGVNSGNQTLGGGTATAIATAASASQNAQFSAIAHISTDKVLINAPFNTDGFDSLAGADYEVLGPLLWAAMTANNPAWQNQALGNSWTSMLWNAFKLANGKGPTACIVFQNGDSGCFQLNPADKNAPAYLSGSGRDKYGNHIERPGQGSISGSGTTMTVVSGYPDTHWTVNSTGYVWLFCEFVGGKLDHCWVQNNE